MTAIGDPVAGLCLAGGHTALPYLGVTLASAFLYMGGMALNDVFDLEVDRKRHPHRVLPSRAIPRSRALQVGAGLLMAGVTTACFVRIEAGVTALALSAAIVLYNSGFKRFALAGCLTMGACRGLNVLVGIHAFDGAGDALPPTWAYWAAVLHVVYTTSVTGLSLLEDQETRPATCGRVFIRLVPALLALGAVPVFLPYHPLVLAPLAFLATQLLWGILPTQEPLTSRAVMKRVGVGVRGILLLDTAYLWGAGGWFAGAVLFALFLASHLERGRGQDQ